MELIEDLKKFQSLFHQLEDESAKCTELESKSKALQDTSSQRYYDSSEDESIVQARALESASQNAHWKARERLDSAQKAVSDNARDRDDYKARADKRRADREAETQKTVEDLKSKESQASSDLNEAKAREAKLKQGQIKALLPSILLGLAGIVLCLGMAFNAEMMKGVAEFVLLIACIGIAVLGYFIFSWIGALVGLLGGAMLLFPLADVVVEHQLVIGLIFLVVAGVLAAVRLSRKKTENDMELSNATRTREGVEESIARYRQEQVDAEEEKRAGDSAQNTEDAAYFTKNDEEREALKLELEQCRSLSDQLHQVDSETSAIIKGAKALSDYNLNMERAQASQELSDAIAAYSSTYHELEDFSKRSPNVPVALSDWARIDQIVHMVESRRAADLSTALNLTDTKEWRDAALKRMESINAQLADMHSDMNMAHMALFEQNQKALELAEKQLEAQFTQISTLEGAVESIDRLNEGVEALGDKVEFSTLVAAKQRAAIIGAAQNITERIDAVQTGLDGLGGTLVGEMNSVEKTVQYGFDDLLHREHED